MSRRGHGDRLDHLLQHCADLGIDVEWADLGPYRRGEYRAYTDRIVLSWLLTRRQAIATLAHELGHRKFGDTCSLPAAERRAWEYGASMLISPEEYRAAEEQVGHLLTSLAIELEVTPKLIEAWRHWWETKGKMLEEARCRRWDA